MKLITRTPETNETEGGQGKAPRSGSGRSVCHLTGARFSFSYLRLENDDNGRFWIKK